MGRASAERIEELLSAITPPTVDDTVEADLETGKRWPVTLVALTLLALVVVGWMLVDAPAAQSPIAVRSRIERDVQALAKLVERYHAEARRYPEAATWRLSALRGDARFLDPWHRPYEYRLGPASFSLGTYGADGKRGGTGANTDLELSFPRTRIDGERAPLRSSDEDPNP